MKSEIEMLAMELADIKAGQRAMHEIFLVALSDVSTVTGLMAKSINAPQPEILKLKETGESKYAELFEHYRAIYRNEIADRLREAGEDPFSGLIN